MHNIGRPSVSGHNTLHSAIRTEVYNDEENEILRINIENTRRNDEKVEKENENIMNIHNMDMSQEVPIIPV